MKVIVLNKNKLTKIWFWHHLIWVILFPVFLSFLLIYLKPDQRNEVVNILSMENIIFWGMLIVVLIMYVDCLIGLFGKEMWFLEDNVIGATCTLFGVVFRKRKWELSNILDVKYAHIPSNSFMLKPGIFGVHNTLSHDAYYEIY